MPYGHILATSAKTIQARAPSYGDPHENFKRAAQIASAALNMPITPYMVAMVLHAVKLGRMAHAPHEPDNYIDGISFLAFAGDFAGEVAEKAPRVPADTVEARPNGSGAPR